MDALTRAVLILRSTLVLVIDRPLAGCYSLFGSSALSRSFVSSLALARRMAVQRPTAATIAPMPWHDRKPDPWYAIRTRKGPWGIVYRVAFTRHGKNVARLFRERDFGNARPALKAARGWRDQMTQSLFPETKQEFSQRVRPDNTSGYPGVYLKRQIVRRGDWSGEYTHWQAQTPQGVKPSRSRSFSVDRYGFDGACELAVQARAEFVAQVEGFVGVTPIPERFRPAE